MKKIVSFLLTITLLLCNGIAVLAEEIPMPPADQISSNPSYAFVEKHFYYDQDENSSTRAGEDGMGIVYINALILPKSSNSVSISLTTTANMICMEIGGIYRIERWINNDWSIYTIDSFWSRSASSGSIETDISVESGYYYRIYCIHMAFSTRTTASIISTTESVLVN